MNKQNVIAIFDIGKTNKKLFLFNENYKIVLERSASFSETLDEDGDPCEDLDKVRLFVTNSLQEVFQIEAFEIKAVNFSGYGASLVYLNKKGAVMTPLYNYLKNFPEDLKRQFYHTYGGEEEFSFRTASPVLGSLNSGMQLYRIKYEKPALFQEINYALHLPQFLSFLISGRISSDLTSIGCHTNLWDFHKNEYHAWVKEEGVLEKLPPILPSTHIYPCTMGHHTYSVGIGLHDSSASLIPYLMNFQEPFVLISTGTWCISLNPFNDSPLTKEELEQDCLCYMTYTGKPVKASRLFAGQEHEDQIKRIGAYFNQDPAKYWDMDFNAGILPAIGDMGDLSDEWQLGKDVPNNFLFGKRDLADFENDERAYHQLILDIILRQRVSTQLVLKNSKVKRIFVDGGFGKNAIYMNLLSACFPDIEVFAASMAQATAIGAALCIHDSWNEKPFPGDIIELKHFPFNR